MQTCRQVRHNAMKRDRCLCAQLIDDLDGCLAAHATLDRAFKEMPRRHLLDDIMAAATNGHGELHLVVADLMG